MLILSMMMNTWMSHDPLSSCHQHPELVLLDSQLSQLETEAFYYETNDTPESFGWSLVKISRTVVKVGADSSDGSHLNISECVELDFLSREGVPGFDIIETAEVTFWVRIVHRTRKVWTVTI